MILTRPIILLSLVSLFTDIASEMLYPVMPIYLGSIGFSVFYIGVLEGFAEATAGLSKGYFGNLSDAMGRRLPFVRGGYALSAISKPMMAVSVFPGWIFLSRTVDRLGKGIRTAARDAMLSDASAPEHRGRVFGFHRALDTTGALLGPVLSLTFLYYLPGQYRTLFILAFIPGAFAILLTLFLSEMRGSARARPGLLDFLKYAVHGPRSYRKLIAGLLFFALMNSSDAFLILLMKQRGVSDSAAILAYIFYNTVFALAAYPAGMAADRFGAKRMLTIGLMLFAFVYAAMPYAHSPITFALLLALYGIYAAATEGIGKAWITTTAAPEDVATAVGTFASLQSICTICASATAGALWLWAGPEIVFGISAAGTFIAAMYFVFAFRTA